MMLLRCSSNALRSALTAAVYFLTGLSAGSSEECGLQMAEKMKSRSAVFRNVDMELCQPECIEDSFIFASCCRSSEKSQKIEEVCTESCGSKVCNHNFHCVEQGCKKICMEVSPLCDLHTASKTGDLSKAKFLLSQGRAVINCQEWIGRTPVIWAAAGGHREVLELLISKGANLTLVDRFGINILHSASLGGDVEVVKVVLSLNILDINDRVRCGRTAVMLASENGHKHVVELLVDKKADVSLVDETGDNILHCACRRGHLEVVKYILLQDMVDINSPEHSKSTPVMVAAEEGQTEVVKLLVQHGANLSLSDRRGDNALHRACYAEHFDVVKYILSLNTVDINSRGYMKRTPVMVAAEHGHKDTVKLLVNHGADLSIRETSGSNILHNACYRGRFDVVKYILSLSTVDINSRGYMKRTPVIVAAERGYKEVVELLVKHGADLSLREKSGSNILHNACYYGQFNVVKYVLSLSTVDINSRGYMKRTPVMVAAERGYKEVVELLVKHGADLSLREKSGSNILHNACYRGQYNVVKYVLSLNTVDINSAGWKKRTPVMVAAEQGYKEVVELLVKHGANLSLKDDDSKNIVDLARHGGHLQVVRYVMSL